MSYQDFNNGLYQGLNVIGIMVLLFGFIYFLISLVDIPLQYHLFRKKAKMTIQELKEARKEEDINPEVKKRVRQIQRTLAERKMLANVPSSDVIITNPTHFAVAIEYKDNIQEAPVIIALGVDHMAQIIIGLGKKNDCPIVMHPLLARTLYYNTNIGNQIPLDLYLPVAKILAHVRQFEAYKKGKRTSKPEFPIIDIPERYRNKT